MERCTNKSRLEKNDRQNATKKKKKTKTNKNCKEKITKTNLASKKTTKKKKDVEKGGNMVVDMNTNEEETDSVIEIE